MSRSENDWNAALRSELNLLGLNARHDESIPVGSGTIRPDIYFEYNGRSFAIEGKLAPDTLDAAISQALGYKTALNRFYSCDTVFGVRYPRHERKPIKAAVISDIKPHYLIKDFTSLHDCAKWIFELSTTPPEALTLDADSIIHTLRYIVGNLVSAFSTIRDENIQGLFGGKEIFTTILGYQEESKIPIKSLRDAAAFLLINQILFYEFLARTTGEFEPIDPETLQSCIHLQTHYFDKVLKVNYRPIFAFRVAAELKRRRDLHIVKGVIKQLKLLLPHLQEGDILGKVFHKLVPLELRKLVAAFYTNDRAADLLARLAIWEAEQRVIDPACGSGTLLAAAYTRKVDLANGSIDSNTHKRFLQEQITGIDVMPFAAHLAAINLVMQKPSVFLETLRIGIEDSTTLTPKSIVTSSERKLKYAFRTRTLYSYTSISEAETAVGRIELSPKDPSAFKIGLHDVVIMNPPFTRGHTIPNEYKKALKSRFSRYQKYIQGLTSFQGYFLLLADKLLRKGGRIAAVLPASTFCIRSHLGLTRYILRKWSVEHVILSRGRSAFSEETHFREILLVARKEPPSPSHYVQFSVIEKSPAEWTAADVDWYYEVIANKGPNIPPGQFVSFSGLLIRRVKQTELKASPRSFYKNILITNQNILNAYEALIALAKRKEIQPFQTVMSSLGVTFEINPRSSFAYGFKAINFLPNESSCIKDNDVWVIARRGPRTITVRHRFSQQVETIRLAKTVPCFRRISGLTSIDGTEAVGLTLADISAPVLDRLLTKTFTATEAREYKLKLWKEWPRRMGKLTHLVLAYKLDLGASGTRMLAVVFKEPAYAAGDAWIFPQLKLNDARILAVWMNSTFFLLDLLINRTEHRGSWMRFDKPVVKDLLLVNPRALSKMQREEFLKLYGDLKQIRYPPLLAQLGEPKREAADRRILEILGLDGPEAKKLAHIFGLAAYESINELVRMMKGD